MATIDHSQLGNSACLSKTVAELLDETKICFSFMASAN